MGEIQVKELDQKFKYDIASHAGAENFKRCLTCGTCTASCPVAEVNEEYDPRKIIRMAVLGMREAVLSSDIIWMCSRCYTCYARCPQDVKFTDVMVVLREMAVKEGSAPAGRIEQIRELDRCVHSLRCEMVSYALHPDRAHRNVVEARFEAAFEQKALGRGNGDGAAQAGGH